MAIFLFIFLFVCVHSGLIAKEGSRLTRRYNVAQRRRVEKINKHKARSERRKINRANNMIEWGTRDTSISQDNTGQMVVAKVASEQGKRWR